MLFKIGHSFHERSSLLFFYIMSQDEGVAMALGPEVNIGNTVESTLLQYMLEALKLKPYVTIFNRPTQRKVRLLALPVALSAKHAQRPGDERFYLIIQSLCLAELPLFRTICCLT